MVFENSGGVMRRLACHIAPLIVPRLVVLIQCAQGALVVDAGFAEQGGGGGAEMIASLVVLFSASIHRLELH
jgi:hypothetical protein